MAKKIAIKKSFASMALANLDGFGLAVKAMRRKIKPTLKVDPVQRNKNGKIVAPKSRKRA